MMRRWRSQRVQTRRNRAQLHDMASFEASRAALRRAVLRTAVSN
ncbi:MAG: hypothetical protein V9E94_00980 [Microthrixaceae bacterium]